MLALVLLATLALTTADDVGCSSSISGGQPGRCMQNGCCHSNFHVTDSSLCNSVGEVCCYRADICNPSSVRREHRGIWVASVWNIDWPNAKTQSAATSQAQLTALFDIAKEVHANAVYFQVRPMGDALYQSTLEPWSEWLTGTQGVPPNPLWDPLAYAIEEGKRRGVEVHAWLNPYRANVRASTSALSSTSWCRRWSQYCYPYSSYMWMDPGAAVVQDHLYNVIIDLATRYDLDGIHFDDYFYPYPVTGVPFPDDSTYNAYVSSGGPMNRADWRRDNVNRLVERVYNGLRSLSVRPFVRFSIGPFGIYRPGHPEGMPPPIQGLDQYAELYADAKKWLNNGWVDILQPQLYWKVNAPNQPYEPLLEWWLGENTQGRHINAGLYFAQVSPDEGNWDLSEIQTQVDISRQHISSGSYGNILYSYQIYRDNVKNARTVFQSDPYPDVCLQPEMAWLRPLATPAVPAPTNAYVTGSNLRWDADNTGVVYNWAVLRHTPTDLTLVAVLPVEQNYYNGFERGELPDSSPGSFQSSGTCIHTFGYLNYKICSIMRPSLLGFCCFIDKIIIIIKNFY